MSVADNSILHDVVIRIKSLLASGISDPLSRDSTGSSFILSSYPDKIIRYPVIVTSANLGNSNKMGMFSEMASLPVSVKIDVMTKSTKQRDEMTGSIFNLLRTSEYGMNATTGSGTILERLYDFKLNGTVDLDEPGIDGMHRKIINCSYNYVTNG
jgi:hypothetical protein